MKLWKAVKSYFNNPLFLLLLLLCEVYVIRHRDELFRYEDHMRDTYISKVGLDTRFQYPFDHFTYACGRFETIETLVPLANTVDKAMEEVHIYELPLLQKIALNGDTWFSRWGSGNEDQTELLGCAGRSGLRQRRSRHRYGRKWEIFLISGI